ncbi:hypothetical protein ACHAXR_008480 [Thalassiosira sp. AJA248-18]
MLPTIILLQGVILSSASCLSSAASAPFHLSSAQIRHRISRNSIDSNLQSPSASASSWSTTRSSIAFMVPRGGGSIADDDDLGNDNNNIEEQQQRYTTDPTTIVCNGGGMEPSSNNNAIQQLAQQYNIDLPTSSKRYNSILPSTTTTLQEALQKANADARFLICYISKNNKGKDTIAIPNLLSPEFVKVINRNPLGKKQSTDTGSYYIWIANDANDTKDAENAMKRLKLKPPTSAKKTTKTKKNSSAAPILAIIYPSTAIHPSTGKLTVTPRTLAQHHCHPPPSSPTTLIAWTNSIRKRHLREYSKLQHDKKELQLLQERTRGYVASVNEDKEREYKDELERKKKEEEEEKERLRKQGLEERRKMLLEGLAEEPEVGSDGVITIALRFTTGSGGGGNDRRRFDATSTTMNDVFNWIDAMHGLEREVIELSTMNGARKFRYVKEESDADDDEEGGSDGEGENLTLEEVGLGKMTALRVTEIVVEEAEDEDGGESVEEDEEGSEYDEEESDEE